MDEQDEQIDAKAQSSEMTWRIHLPIQCLVCGLPAGGGMSLCQSCCDVLPWQPPGCRCCGEVLPEASLHRGVCGSCITQPPIIDRCQSALSYEPPADLLLHRFKFHGDFASGRVLGRLLLARMAGTDGLVGSEGGYGSGDEDREESGDFWGAEESRTLLVPVPLHPSRQRRRGFNQARELARPLVRGLGLPLSLKALARRRRTQAQSESPTAAARRRNLRGAFQANSPALAGVARVILIDDVITTKSTVLAAATALKRAGVPRVEAWSVLRAN